MSFLIISLNIQGNCGGDFGRRWSCNLATEVAPTKTEQEALV